jgi:hypothetical protein
MVASGDDDGDETAHGYECLAESHEQYVDAANSAAAHPRDAEYHGQCARCAGVVGMYCDHASDDGLVLSQHGRSDEESKIHDEDCDERYGERQTGDHERFQPLRRFGYRWERKEAMVSDDDLFEIQTVRKANK